MPDRRLHRGPHPDDARLFGPGALGQLQAAAAEFCWLLDRGYPHDSTLKLVGDRYDLVARQRSAVSRCCCSRLQAARRQSREVGGGQVRGAALWLDGYNVLTTIEAALAGGVILSGRDGAYRDMASMHGTYRKVAETLPALGVLGRILEEERPAECRWLLDAPVSNSGRLRGIIEEMAAIGGWPWTVELLRDPDAVLVQASADVAASAAGRPQGPPGVIVATADSAILDRCGPWFNLARQTIRRHIRGARLVELADADRVGRESQS
jgi:hypothetical protein